MGRGKSKAGGRGAGKSDGSFTTFPDESIKSGSRHIGGDTWDYEGDGEAQKTFFREYSNCNRLIGEMSDRDKERFRAWSSGDFMFGQQYRGFSNMDKRDQEATRTFDKVLDKSFIMKGVQVVRRSDAQLLFGEGHRTTNIKELKAMKGKIIHSKANLSFAAAKEGLTIGHADEKPIEYRLKIPGGSKGAGMYIADHRIHAWGRRQREFMSNRDVNFKVGDPVYDKARGLFVVDLEYAGREEHDYS